MPRATSGATWQGQARVEFGEDKHGRDGQNASVEFFSCFLSQGWPQIRTPMAFRLSNQGALVQTQAERDGHDA